MYFVHTCVLEKKIFFLFPSNFHKLIMPFPCPPWGGQGSKVPAAKAPLCVPLLSMWGGHNDTSQFILLSTVQLSWQEFTDHVYHFLCRIESSELNNYGPIKLGNDVYFHYLHG